MIQPSPTTKLPPNVQVLSMLFGPYVSQALLMVAEFHLADLVRDGQKSAAQLASATQTDELNLTRLLRTLTALGVFAEPEPGYFAATELSACLQSDNAETLYNLTLFLVGFAEKSLNGLSYSLRTGKPAFTHLYGKDVWHYFAEDDPQTGALFHRAMTSLSGPSNRAICEAYDFSEIETLVDVGGGEGSFLVMALERNPRLQGILFDQPAAIEQAKERIAQADIADRCQLIAGNFLESIPPGADAYLFKHVLVDWDDAACAIILRNCITAMKRDGRILVVDTLPGPGPEGLPGRLNDLNMMINTGGHVREEEELRQLFAAAGLSIRRILPTHSTDNIIEAVIAS